MRNVYIENLFVTFLYVDFDKMRKNYDKSAGALCLMTIK